MNTLLTVALVLVSGGLGEQGNGKVSEQAREAGEFHAVAVGSGIEAKVTLGPKASLKITTDENLASRVLAEVKGGKLKIWTQDSLRATVLKVAIVATKLDEVEASGGAHVEAIASAGSKFQAESSGGAHLKVRDIASDEVVASASGGSELAIAGKARKLVAEASGAARIEAWELPVEAAKVEASGAAKLFANVTGEVQGSASGASAIHFKGKPQKRDVSTSGASQLVSE